MERNHNILDTPPRGSDSFFKPPTKLRRCWMYGSGPQVLSNIEMVSVTPLNNHTYDWNGLIPDGTEFVDQENVTFVHSCAEQKRLQKRSLRGTKQPKTYHGVAYVVKRDGY